MVRRAAATGLLVSLALASSSAFLHPTNKPSAAHRPRLGAARAMVMRSEEGKASSWSVVSSVAKTVLPGLAALASLGVAPSFALDPNTRALPPIDDTDKAIRCKFKSSAIGQANAARDKLYDLRLCDMSKQSAVGFDLSGAIMSEADFQGVNFKDATLSKAYAAKSNFDGADFTNAVLDRVTFDFSTLKGALFRNAVLSRTDFEKADLTDTDFTDAYLGDYDVKFLCKNKTLKGTNPVTNVDTRESASCP